MPVASTPMPPVPVPWPQPLRFTQASHTEQIPVFPVPCSGGPQADLVTVTLEATLTAFLQTYRVTKAEGGKGTWPRPLAKQD